VYRRGSTAAPQSAAADSGVGQDVAMNGPLSGTNLQNRPGRGSIDYPMSKTPAKVPEVTGHYVATAACSSIARN
jgi:hypothetical protein